MNWINSRQWKGSTSITARLGLAGGLIGLILKIHWDGRLHKNKQLKGVFVHVYVCLPSFSTRTAGLVQILALHLLGSNLAVTILLGFLFCVCRSFSKQSWADTECGLCCVDALGEVVLVMSSKFNGFHPYCRCALADLCSALEQWHRLCVVLVECHFV